MQWLHQFTFPPTVYKGSLFCTSSLTFVICGLFDDSHSDRSGVISHCGFDLCFSDVEWCWASFHVPVGHLRFLFGKMSIQVFCPFFNWGVCFFCCSVAWAVFIFWILTPYWSYHLQKETWFVQHEWIANELCWVKEVRRKRAFHLYKVTEYGN